MRRGYFNHNKLQLLKTKSIEELPNENSLGDLLKTVTNWYSPKIWEKIKEEKYSDYNFCGAGGTWKNSNQSATSKEWVSIYRHSAIYSDNWLTSTLNLKNTLKRHCPSLVETEPFINFGPDLLTQTGYQPEGNVLDFGAGVGKPWVDIPEKITLFMLEINIAASKKLKEVYKDDTNVRIVTDLNSIKDIRFDWIYSKDVLEHVRHINEHLDIFYILGKKTCRYNLLIDIGSSRGHVYGLHKDSELNPFWNKLYNYGSL